MNNYELMVIFTPVLSEEDFKAAQKKYASLVKENGGEVVHLSLIHISEPTRRS